MSFIKNSAGERYRKKLKNYYQEMSDLFIRGENPFDEQDIDRFIDSLRANFPASRKNIILPEEKHNIAD